MHQSEHLARTTRFRNLNLEGRLLLPNAWDAASARVFEQAGFPALATTSGGIANARGLADGERMGRDVMVREIASIVNAVAIPTSADIEAGYGDAPADVGATVDAVLDLGVVGVNLEDRAHRARTAPLYGMDEQAARIGAARAAADRRGIPLVLNARTDTFLLGIGDSLEDRVEMTAARGRAYLKAGADLVFVPALVDLDAVNRLARMLDGRLSVMALPGAPDADAFFRAGASRVSLGNVAMLASLGALRDIANDIRRTGTWSSMERTFFGFHEAEALFSSR